MRLCGRCSGWRSRGGGLLEWETARESQRRARGDVGGFFSAMAAEPVLAAGISAALAFTRPGVLWAAGPVLGLWLISPGLAWWLSRPLAEKGTEARSSASGIAAVHGAARRGDFLRTFVGGRIIFFRRTISRNSRIR